MRKPNTVANIPLGSPNWNPDSEEGFAAIEFNPDFRTYTFEAHDGANSVYLNTTPEALFALAETITFLLKNNGENHHA